MKRMNNIFKTYIFIAVFALFAGASVFLTIEVVTTSSEISAMEEVASELLARQSELRETLVRTVSVSKLREQSESLGFVKVQNIIYVGDEESVARIP